MRCPGDADFFLRVRSARSPFPSIEPPCLSQAIDVTEGDRDLPLRTRIVHWIILDYMHASILLREGRWHLSPQCAMSIFYANEIRELAQ